MILMAVLLTTSGCEPGFKDWKTTADAFVGMRYVHDAVLDDKGNTVTFNRPDQVLEMSGLNCSGLVVSAARVFFNQNFKVQEVIKDYNQNSGPTAALGHDWDFGWDLLYNLSQNRKRFVFNENLNRINPEKVQVENFRGFKITDKTKWQKLFSQLKKEAVYLVVFNGLNTRKENILQYFHVGFMLKTSEDILFYSASRENPNRGVDVHRLMVQKEFEHLLGQNRRYTDIRVIVFEVLVKNRGEINFNAAL